jgi:acetyl esterase/lipase
MQSFTRLNFQIYFHHPLAKESFNMTKYCSRLISICLLSFTITLLNACASPGDEPSTPSGEAVSTATTLPEATPLPPTAPPPQPTATPEPTATAEPAEATVIEDIVYATAVDPDAQEETLDIHYLPGSNAGKPVVIWAHGSALDSSSGRIFGRLLAREGYVVMAINWQDLSSRGGGTADLREALEDATCVLRFAAEHGQEYGADPNRVVWAGYSAGAWLGSLVAFGEGDPFAIWDAYAAENDGPEQRVQCAATADPAKISAYIPSAGSYPGGYWLGNDNNPYYSEFMSPLSGYSAIGHNPDLQVRMLHGTRDLASDTAFENAQAFADALQEAGYDVEFLPQDGAHESFQTQAIEQILALEE